MDRSIDPTGDQIRKLRDQGPEGPVVMVNLLKFRESAVYPLDRDEPPRSGREAYYLYEHAFTVTVQAVGQAEVMYRGPVNQIFIGQMDDPSAAWDDVLIVRYPSRQHFLAMLADANYRDALVHRYAGLERTITLQCNG